MAMNEISLCFDSSDVIIFTHKVDPFLGSIDTQLSEKSTNIGCTNNIQYNCTEMCTVCYYGITKQMLTRSGIFLTDGECCRLICSSIHKAKSIGHSAAISKTICIILQWKFCRKEKELYLNCSDGIHITNVD